MLILKKIMVFLLVFAICVVIRDVLLLVKAFKSNEKLDRTLKHEIVLGCSISYILTIIFTGFQML